MVGFRDLTHAGGMDSVLPMYAVRRQDLFDKILTLAKTLKQQGSGYRSFIAPPNAL